MENMMGCMFACMAETMMKIMYDEVVKVVEENM